MKKITSLLVLITISFFSAPAQNPDLDLQVFSTGYSNPVDIGSCNDNRLFIVEKTGNIWICDASGNKSATPFLSITNKVYDNGNEQGLLGIAFHPNYKSNGYFYVNYINNQQNTTIARFSVNPNDSNKAMKSSELKLLNVTQPFDNHNGGCLKFGPDGYLYIGLGDGGSGGDPNNNGQKKGKYLGKMLRIDVDGASPYAIPANNPFVGVQGYKEEIWALGLRNPWRFSFDRLTGDLYIGDVGQELWEEVDFQPASSTGGENYGWRCYEANHTYNTSGCGPIGNYDFPVAEYAHGINCSITGGYVYRGSLYPNMMGKYFLTDYCSGRFRMLYNDGTWHLVSLESFDAFAYSTFGQDKNGELYVGSLADGNIYHIIDESAPFQGKFSIDAGTPVQPLLVFPNPASSNFSVRFESAEESPAIIRVLNSLGQIVFEEKDQVVKGVNTWNVPGQDLSEGIYMVTLSTISGKQIVKLMVQK